MATSPLARKRLGLHAPYFWDDTTQAAIPLMDVAAHAEASTPLWLASQAYSNGIHGVWDNKVLRQKRDDFCSWVLRCRHVLWFDIQRDKLELAKMAGCKNTLILMWHRSNLTDLAAFPEYDNVVCPHRSA